MILLVGMASAVNAADWEQAYWTEFEESTRGVLCIQKNNYEKK
jgi:hypothetical protein